MKELRIDTVITFGKYNGKTLLEIHNKDKKYFKWLFNVWKGGIHESAGDLVNNWSPPDYKAQIVLSNHQKKIPGTHYDKIEITDFHISKDTTFLEKLSEDPDWFLSTCKNDQKFVEKLLLNMRRKL